MREKGNAAEGTGPYLRTVAWVVGEYPPDCHIDLMWSAMSMA